MSKTLEDLEKVMGWYYKVDHLDDQVTIQDQLNAALDQWDKAEAEVTRLNAELETVEDKLQKIQRWSEAYPEGVFPEPDWKHVAGLLGDTLLTQCSGAYMRRVFNGVRDILNEDTADALRAIAGGEGSE